MLMVGGRLIGSTNMERVSSLLLIFLMTSLVVFSKADDSDAKCLVSQHHKGTPSPEDNFQECTSWEKNSCCPKNVSNSIHLHRSTKLHNFHWTRCGQVSETCERYLINELCFYQCEPQLIKFGKLFDGLTLISGVPICASYCQGWFEACRTDMTCVEDWLGHWDYERDETGQNHCPANSECVTFEEMYGDAKGLCDKMWGNAFSYEEGDNCMVMEFNSAGENPNSDVIPPTSSSPRQLASLGPLAATLLIFLIIIN